MNRFIKGAKVGGPVLSALALCWNVTDIAPLWAADRHMMMPRVPSDQIEQARALTNPLPESAEIVEKGKALYEGKGACVTCHGTTGRGDGSAAAGLDPSPRNFRNHGFWSHRTEGEIFWVIKHGSPGTGMIGFGSMLSDEEMWAIIEYERSFAGGHGRERPMGRGGMGEMGRGPERGMGSPDRPCCDDEPR
jgi:mono/diheme cytochrome c family protein